MASISMQPKLHVRKFVPWLAGELFTSGARPIVSTAALATGCMPLSPFGLVAVASGGTTVFTSGTPLPGIGPDSGVTGLTGICPPSGTKGLTGMLSGALAIGFYSLNKLML